MVAPKIGEVSAVYATCQQYSYASASHAPPVKPAQSADATASHRGWSDQRVKAPLVMTATVLLPTEAFQEL